MKFFNKKPVKNILMILLVILVILPAVARMLSLPIKEGMKGDSMKDTDISMNRININYNTGLDASYAYCVNGTVTCGSDYDISMISDDSFDYGADISGETYEPACYKSDILDETVTPKCENGIFSDKDKVVMYGLEEKDGVLDISLNMKRSLNKISDPLYTGFSEVTAHQPLKLDEEGELLYKGNSEYIKTLKCFLFDTSTNCIKIFNDLTDDGDTEEGEEENKEEGEEEKCDGNVELKCLAHYGTKVGDPLCCGQTGVLQNTQHVCPEELPTCLGYECGSSWGKCVSSDATVE